MGDERCGASDLLARARRAVVVTSLAATRDEPDPLWYRSARLPALGAGACPHPGGGLLVVRAAADDQR